MPISHANSLHPCGAPLRRKSTGRPWPLIHPSQIRRKLSTASKSRFHFLVAPLQSALHCSLAHSRRPCIRWGGKWRLHRRRLLRYRNDRTGDVQIGHDVEVLNLSINSTQNPSFFNVYRKPTPLVGGWNCIAWMHEASPIMIKGSGPTFHCIRFPNLA